jgi:hypothetical protein
MSANGISTSLPKSNRANLKLALSQTIRSTVPATVSDSGVVWTEQIYDPTTLVPPASFTYWKASTHFALNIYIDVNGVFYKCTTAGTSGAAAPTWTRYFGYRPLNVIDTPEVNPPRPTPLAAGRPWDL